MEDAQSRFLSPTTIIEILDIQPLRRIIKHPSNLPPRVEIKVPSWRLSCLSIRRPNRMQVYPLIGGNTCFALRRPLHSIDTSDARRRTIRLNLGLGNEIRSCNLFLLAPGTHPREHGLDRLVGAVALPCAQRGKLGALVFLSKPVLEAVLAIAVRAAHAGVFKGVDECFARDVGALVGVVDVGLFRRSAVLLKICCTVASTSPVSGVGTFVGGFGAVVEAEGAPAGFAAEGEEVELSAVFELAVAAD